MSRSNSGTDLRSAPVRGAAERPFRVRGLRGATTAREDTPAAIEEAVHELLAELVATNGVDPDDLAAAFFSVTDDLRSAFPATGARSFGWDAVPLLDVREASSDGDLERCVRVLLLWNTRRTAQEVRHVYLRDARGLRPDLWDPLPAPLTLAGS